MDYSVKWSPEATEDLESKTEYIARDSEFYARSTKKVMAIREEDQASYEVPAMYFKNTYHSVG